MDLTRKQLINTDPSKGIGGPMNTFNNIPAFPAADVKVVVRPNFDTLYSSAWVDLTREPAVNFSANRLAATISSLCSICGPMCLPRQVGERRAQRLVIFCSSRRAGMEKYQTGFHPYRGADALRLDYRSHQDRWPRGLRRGARHPERLQDTPLADGASGQSR